MSLNMFLNYFHLSSSSLTVGVILLLTSKYCKNYWFCIHLGPTTFDHLKKVRETDIFHVSASPSNFERVTTKPKTLRYQRYFVLLVLQAQKQDGNK